MASVNNNLVEDEAKVKIKVYLSPSGTVCIWNAEDVYHLRQYHHIVGVLVGALPSLPQQNKLHGLPLVLSQNETSWLLEKEILELYACKDDILSTKQVSLVCDDPVSNCNNMDTFIDIQQSNDSDKNVCLPNQLTFDNYMELITSDSWPRPQDSPNVQQRYMVYRDLMQRGCYITEGTKFGGDFLVYMGDPVAHHSQFIVGVRAYRKTQSMRDLLAVGRLATSAKKIYVLASVVDEGEIESLNEQIPLNLQSPRNAYRRIFALLFLQHTLPSMSATMSNMLMASVQTVGFWGLPTSSIDWCESNYAVTHYVAEFFNTISNIATCAVALAVFIFIRSLHLESFFSLSSMLVGLVGIGSFCFHGTLLHEAQMLDELPMIYMQLIFLYIVLENGQQVKYKNLARYMWMFGIGYSLIHYYFRFVFVFHIIFGILVAPMLVPLIIHWADLPLRQLMIQSFVLFGVSIVLWQVDLSFCSSVRQFYLHAVWHMGTAAAAGSWIMGAVYARLKYTRGYQSTQIGYKWGIIPYVFVASAAERSLLRILNTDKDEYKEVTDTDVVQDKEQNTKEPIRPTNSIYARDFSQPNESNIQDLTQRVGFIHF